MATPLVIPTHVDAAKEGVSDVGGKIVAILTAWCSLIEKFHARASAGDDIYTQISCQTVDSQRVGGT